MSDIEVLICTIDHGIENVIQNIPSPMKQVRYLISWQQTQSYVSTDISPLTIRKDVEVVSLKGKGLSANRNHALAHAHGDILIIADDDVLYKEEYFKAVAQAFSAYPDAEIILFQVLDEKGNPIKSYSSKTHLYQHRPKFSYVSSWEIAIRNNGATLPRFDSRFGLGAPFLSCGEEEIFIEQAYRNGANIRYVPTVIAQTAKGTTGSKFTTDAKVRHSKGAVLYVFHGYFSAVLRCFKEALHYPISQQFRFFKDMYDGIQYIRKSKS